jgi:hypothetical protein
MRNYADKSINGGVKIISGGVISGGVQISLFITISWANYTVVAKF